MLAYSLNQIQGVSVSISNKRPQLEPYVLILYRCAVANGYHTPSWLPKTTSQIYLPPPAGRTSSATFPMVFSAASSPSFQPRRLHAPQSCLDVGATPSPASTPSPLCKRRAQDDAAVRQGTTANTDGTPTRTATKTSSGLLTLHSRAVVGAAAAISTHTCTPFGSSSTHSMTPSRLTWTGGSPLCCGVVAPWRSTSMLDGKSNALVPEKFQSTITKVLAAKSRTSQMARMPTASVIRKPGTGRTASRGSSTRPLP